MGLAVQSHQAAMDEKVAEVANLTLRLREMSGKVMWFEALQEEKAAQLKSLEEQVAAAEARVKEVELNGVSGRLAGWQQLYVWLQNANACIL